MPGRFNQELATGSKNVNLIKNYQIGQKDNTEKVMSDKKNMEGTFSRTLHGDRSNKDLDSHRN